MPRTGGRLIVLLVEGVDPVRLDAVLELLPELVLPHAPEEARGLGRLRLLSLSSLFGNGRWTLVSVSNVCVLRRGPIVYLADDKQGVCLFDKAVNPKKEKKTDLEHPLRHADGVLRRPARDVLHLLFGVNKWWGRRH